jgi:NSS family neurotransmitter:Na+ symporter
MATRDTWGSNIGFILAAVGGAVGLGNLWGFAYSASQGGGAAFVLLYLFFVLLVGIPVLTVELAVGRHAHKSTIPALDLVAGRRWRPLGYTFVLAGFGILSFYSVIMGWTGRMLVDFLRGAVPLDTGAYFGEIATGGDAIAAHALGMALTILVVVAGVQRGIERVAMVLMPVLFVLLLGLAAWASTLSGGGAGYAYYLQPDFSKLFETRTITGAAGQAFFSLSLGMGAMITYASYLGGKGSLPVKAGTIALSDTAVAFVGGLLMFPVVYHFGLQQDISDSTIGALFIAVPRGMLSMGGAGQLVGSLFFLALYIAALTSAMSLLEVVTAAIIDTWSWPRKKAAWVAGIVIGVAGIPSALNTDFLGFLFQLFGQVFLVFGGFWLAILAGYFWTEGARAELAQGFGRSGLVTLWIWLLRLVVPVVTIVVLYFAITALIPLARALVS